MRRIALATGVALDVCVAGAGTPLILLHGFPESHRTWAHQIQDLARDHLVVAPDQRGFAGSDKPAGTDSYSTANIVADIFALADALGIGRFTLVGHDWGGAAAWAAALARPDRVARLVIANAPHPLVFQRSLIDDPAQRAASQYMTAFRDPGIGDLIRHIGLDGFYDRQFAPHLSPDALARADRDAYLAEWRRPGALEAMLNWYRASRIIVPAIGAEASRPDWIDRPFPHTQMPVLVIWGMRDTALLAASQLPGLSDVVPDLTVAEIDAGHFVTWEAPDAVTAAIRAFLTARPLRMN